VEVLAVWSISRGGTQSDGVVVRGKAGGKSPGGVLYYGYPLLIIILALFLHKRGLHAAFARHSLFFSSEK
jgi:hypothetical protein